MQTDVVSLCIADRQGEVRWWWLEVIYIFTLLGQLLVPMEPRETWIVKGDRSQRSE